jgi:tripartite-type tricarboxylate transporter receptor subunit TctC
VPSNVVTTVHRHMMTVLDDPKLQRTFEELGIATAKMTPAEFQGVVAKQVGEWAPAVRASGAKLN